MNLERKKYGSIKDFVEAFMEIKERAILEENTLKDNNKHNFIAYLAMHKEKRG